MAGLAELAGETPRQPEVAREKRDLTLESRRGGVRRSFSRKAGSPSRLLASAGKSFRVLALLLAVARGALTSEMV